MATIAKYIAEINHQRDLLAGHLVARGIIATADEKLNLLVHKVSLLPSVCALARMSSAVPLSDCTSRMMPVSVLLARNRMAICVAAESVSGTVEQV